MASEKMRIRIDPFTQLGSLADALRMAVGDDAVEPVLTHLRISHPELSRRVRFVQRGGEPVAMTDASTLVRIVRVVYSLHCLDRLHGLEKKICDDMLADAALVVEIEIAQINRVAAYRGGRGHEGEPGGGASLPIAVAVVVADDPHAPVATAREMARRRSPLARIARSLLAPIGGHF